MRRVIFGGANSLDNYLARPDGAVDWILFGEETAELMKDMWSRFDTIVMGRKTYEHGRSTLRRMQRTRSPVSARSCSRAPSIRRANRTSRSYHRIRVTTFAGLSLRKARISA